MKNFSKYHPITPQQRFEDMKKMRDIGFSYGRIGKAFGISRQRVHQIFKKQSVNNSPIDTPIDNNIIK